MKRERDKEIVGIGSLRLGVSMTDYVELTVLDSSIDSKNYVHSEGRCSVTAVGQAFSEYFGFLCHSSIPPVAPQSSPSIMEGWYSSLIIGFGTSVLGFTTAKRNKAADLGAVGPWFVRNIMF
jgi:hypothetical protein